MPDLNTPEHRMRDLPGGFLDQMRAREKRRYGGAGAQPPNDPPHDPFSWKPAPLPPRPRRPAGSIALDEPDTPTRPCNRALTRR